MIAEVGWPNWILMGFLLGLGFRLASAVVAILKGIIRR